MCYSLKEEKSPCSHRQYPIIPLPPSIQCVRDQSLCFPGRLLSAGAAGSAVYSGQLGPHPGMRWSKKGGRRWECEGGIIGKEKEEEELSSRGAKEECWVSQETRAGEMERQWAQDKEKENGWRVGGEGDVIWHQLSRHKSCYCSWVPLRGAWHPICLSNLFIRFCLPSFHDLKWQNAQWTFKNQFPEQFSNSHPREMLSIKISYNHSSGTSKVKTEKKAII